MTCRDALMPRSQEVKERPILWAVRGVETSGSALHPVGGHLWVSPIDYGVKRKAIWFGDGLGLLFRAAFD